MKIAYLAVAFVAVFSLNCGGDITPPVDPSAAVPTPPTGDADAAAPPQDPAQPAK